MYFFSVQIFVLDMSFAASTANLAQDRQTMIFCIYTRVHELRNRYSGFDELSALLRRCITASDVVKVLQPGGKKTNYDNLFNNNDNLSLIRIILLQFDFLRDVSAIVGGLITEDMQEVIFVVSAKVLLRYQHPRWRPDVDSTERRSSKYNNPFL